ncbi:MAG TPA: HAMP domain-containing sensor histidine kinase [Candidatus Paceibacterota bacterium]|nr:HAMP domain-containing sensor histidine kinase [Candidatus Paceibacterota bacterium]
MSTDAPTRKSRLSITAHCAELGVSIWSCPSFIFVVMGAVICVAIGATYMVGQHYTSPEAVIVIVTVLTIFLLIVTHIIVNAFEALALSRRREREQNKELLDLKDQFVFLAIHDIRAAATAIKWGVRMLEPKRFRKNDPKKIVFEQVRLQNEGLLELARDILDITIVEGGGLKMENELLPIRDIVQDLLAKLRAEAMGRDVAVTIDIPAELPEIRGDEGSLRRILSTLIANAYRYTDEADAAITFTIRSTDGHFTIDVENNGPGIPIEDQSHVFQKFWRGKKGNIEHRGFGLYIAKTMAEQMGGTIAFRSNPGMTVFTLALPRSLVN